MKNSKMTRMTPMVALVGIVALGACAQPEPAPIMPQPVYDKYGNERDGGGGCVGGETAGGADDCIPYDNNDDYEQPGGDGETGGGNDPTGTP